MGNILYAVVESDKHRKTKLTEEEHNDDGLDGLNDQSNISEQSDIGKHM